MAWRFAIGLLTARWPEGITGVVSLVALPWGRKRCCSPQAPIPRPSTAAASSRGQRRRGNGWSDLKPLSLTGERFGSRCCCWRLRSMA